MVYGPQPITFKLIKQLAKTAPPESPKDIRDGKARLILRHQPTGFLGLYVELARGKRERLCNARRIINENDSLTLGQVRETAKRLVGQHVNGRDFATERRAKAAVPTLVAYLDDTYGPWVDEHRREKGVVERIKIQFSKFLKTKLDEITTADVEVWRATRRKSGVSAETINRYVAALRAALTRAVKMKIIAVNPLLGIEDLQVDRRRQPVRALTHDEKQQLIAALHARDEKKRGQRASANEWRKKRDYELLPPLSRFCDALTPAVITSLETGLRRGELFALRWPMIDWRKKELRVEGTTAKTYETRDIPLNNEACVMLRDWWLQCGQPKSGYVFSVDGEPLGNLKKSYHAALKDAGIERVNARGERVNWHSLRHTFGSLLGAANTDPTTLMELMGHASLTTTQRYLHSDARRRRDAVDRLAGAR